MTAVDEQPGVATEPPARQKRALDPWGLLSAALFLVGAASVTGLLSRFWWPFDESSSFRLLYTEAALAAAAIYGCGRRRRQMWTALAVAAFNVLLIVPLYLGGGPAPTRPTCRFLLANVHTSNTDYERLRQLVRDENPDVIVLEEVNDAWLAALDELRQAYPHYLEYPEDDNFGIAFYSRLPTGPIRIETFGEIGVASVTATVEHDGAVWHVVATHPVPPSGAAYWRWRNEQLTNVAAYARDLDGPVVVIGDLNTTPWSYYFHKCARDAGLRDAGKGFGLRLSWPTFFPPMGIPIDHCLVSPDIAVGARRTGRRIGSDHYPVVFDLARAGSR